MTSKIGERLHFQNADTLRRGQPFAAIVSYVHADDLVNVAVFDVKGESFGRVNVPIVGADGPGDRRLLEYCQWPSVTADELEPAAPAKKPAGKSSG